MQVEACMIDLDGTLVDTLDDFVAALHAMLAELQAEVARRREQVQANLTQQASRRATYTRLLNGGSGSGDSSSVLKGGGQDLTRSGGQVKRGGRRFALIAAAGELATCTATKPGRPSAPAVAFTPTVRWLLSVIAAITRKMVGGESFRMPVKT